MSELEQHIEKAAIEMLDFQGRCVAHDGATLLKHDVVRFMLKELAPYVAGLNAKIRELSTQQHETTNIQGYQEGSGE